ncbi:MAG: 4-hydroxy-tetrahydrodipicolinate reductase [Candidatus Latescibacterota bacterium]|jgi:4-hydroxy-tetrahydrodipicolinate reductase
MSAVTVCGVAGRMGQRLAGLILDSEDLTLAAGIERAGHPALGRDLGEAIGRPHLGRPVLARMEEAVAQAAVVVDFTAPEATLAAAAACAAAGKAMVIGTTGFTEIQRTELLQLVTPIPCVFSPSYSTAMNVLFRLVEEAARILGEEYDVEVIEAHHRLKVDAPSGTALKLAERAAAGLGWDLDEVAVHGRQGIVGQRPRRQIGLHAVRAGDLVGDHTVLFGAPGECLELRHRATSRDAFAQGALRAVRFAARAPVGLYSMRDVLGIS